jgi:DNA-binding NarL/FixJ family response regulator
MIRLVIADDSEIIRKALRQFFASEPRFEIVGEAHDYAETNRDRDRSKTGRSTHGFANAGLWFARK